MSNAFTLTILLTALAIAIMVVALLVLKRTTVGGACFAGLKRQAVSIDWLKTGRVVALLTLFASLSWSWFPWSSNDSNDNVARRLNPISIRVKTDGWVERIQVSDGQNVRNGQVLLVLQNPQLRSHLRLLKLDMEKSVLMGKYYLEQQDVVAYKGELSKRRMVQQEITKVENMLDDLVITAECDGVVMADDLQNLLGRYVDTDNRLLMLANPNREQLELSRLHHASDDTESSRRKEMVFSMPLYSDRMESSVDSIEVQDDLKGLSHLTKVKSPVQSWTEQMIETIRNWWQQLSDQPADSFN